MLRNMLGKTQFLGSMIVILSIALFAVACGGDEEPTPVPATSAPVATAAPAATAAPTEAPAAVEEPAVVEDSDEVIAFHDGQWGSNWVHLAIARYILENGYGRETKEVQGSTGTMKLTLVEGDVHVNMETWRMNIPVWYEEHTASGAIVDLAGTTDPLTSLPPGSPGQTVAVAGQGFYVPRYMIEGDAERGIEATAPDLKSVQDLRKYKELFADPNDPTKGAVYNCILGWECQKVNRAKWFAYDMYTDFNVIEPGGSAALKAAVVAPYEAGEPFVSYYWQPTDVVNLRDLVLLEEPAWNQECQDATDAAVAEEPYESTIGCAFPISDTHTVVNGEFAKRNPRAVQFLTNYYVGPKPLAQAEAYKAEADVEWVTVAIKYLRENEDIWSTWITDENSAEIIANVKSQLDLEPATPEVAVAAPAMEESGEVIAFHDGQWGSNWVHLAIARYILENGYGRETKEVQGSTGTMKLTLVEGDVHVNMETWRMNIPVWYEEHTASGAIVDLAGTTDPLTSLPPGSPGQTVAVAGQGFYVPRYMIEGDAERGIEATAPDLKSVQDLRKYKELFADPNDPTKGAVYNCILGWECQKVNRAKWFAYDMYTDFNVIEPGGSAALKAAVVAPYEAGEPFVSYYWQPTDVVNLRDLVLLEEPAWNQECQDATDAAVAEEPYESTIGCAFPISDTHTVVNGEFAKRNPRVIQFLTNYYVDAKPLAEAEAYKAEADVEWVDVAIKYLKENEDVWSTWITDDNRLEIIANVKSQLSLED